MKKKKNQRCKRKKIRSSLKRLNLFKKNLMTLGGRLMISTMKIFPHLIVKQFKPSLK